MSARDELKEFILQWVNDDVWMEDILDDYANEIVKQVADKLETEVLHGKEFGGGYDAAQYLRGLSYGYGIPQSPSGTATS